MICLAQKASKNLLRSRLKEFHLYLPMMPWFGCTSSLFVKNHAFISPLAGFTRRLATSSKNTDLKAVLAEKVIAHQKVVREFRKANGNKVVGNITVNMLYGGMRGLLGLICETSLLHINDGIRFRGYTIAELQKLLPRAEGSQQPLPEGIAWLLFTGDIPSKEQVDCISREWIKRADVPPYVVCMLNTFQAGQVHPMTQLSMAVTALNVGSHFVEAYNKGVKKTTYWEHTYEDAMDLIAKLPVICAMIYRNTYKEGKQVGAIDARKDWAANFASMLGFKDPQFTELMRLYLTIHCDHEGGNVSAHTTHLVGSALSDPYLSYASGINGLAGPLHGLATQEALVFITKIRKELGDNASDEKVKEFCEKTLKSGQVIPGFGHAILRQTDPRYTCQREYALKYLPNDPVFKLVGQLFKIVPPVLKATGKVQNPWPNVDAHSGVLLQYYGLTEMNFYTVLFALSRCVGCMASLVWDRALLLPLERPKSVTTKELMKMVKGK